MEAKLFHSLTPKAPLIPISLTPPKPSLSLTLLRRHPPSKLTTSIRAADEPNRDVGPTQITPPPESVEVRFRRRPSRRQRNGGDGSPAKAPAKVKKWEDMSAAEKAMELYVGERGALYWLNKLAYASIFIVIGAWILFRFVGPALNLYQLDTPPLSPDAVFKGS